MIDNLESKRIIVDTNVFVSLLLGRGTFRTQLSDLFAYILDNAVILESKHCLDELHEVLSRDKFSKYLPKDKVIRFIQILKAKSELVEVNNQIDDCRDKDDNKFLELAISGKADLIVTGDKDLLELNPYHDVYIISPSEAYNILSRSLSKQA